MKVILLIDFGSTWTKVTAVDADTATLLGTAAAFTTVETDVGEGLAHALAKLEESTGPLVFAERIACSSAAGGLRMMVSGLTLRLTAEAAKLASFGAGAKVQKTYSYELTDEDVREIEEQKPDIFLLTGGVDGGDRECILHNAKMLASCQIQCPILIAGNIEATEECERILAGRELYCCPNVMPRLRELNIEPVQEKIRDLFLRQIVQAKGLTKASELLSGIVMPTPFAVLNAMELLAEGTERQSGWGELVAVDLGGATTDVYSIADGTVSVEGAVITGLTEPYAKRTVEGDIGMRYNAPGILEAVGPERLMELSGLGRDAVESMVQQIHDHPEILPATPEQRALDGALARAAIETAVTRHAGTLERVFTRRRSALVQRGKNLTGVRNLILTGGAIIHAEAVEEIARYALYRPSDPTSLKPRMAEVYLDRQYILAAMGLLGQRYPDVALTIMKQQLEPHGMRELADA